MTTTTGKRPEAYKFVSHKLFKLVAIRTNPTGAATLAKLRRAADKKPGTDPDIWDWTMEGIWHPLGHEETATPTEVAVHAALTMYALHQQSVNQPMHAWRVGLGEAVARLDRVLPGPTNRDRPAPGRARLARVMASNTPQELADRIRYLIPLLREHQIPLDYAMIADCIEQFANPAKRDQIRLVWSRQLATSTTLTTTPASQEEHTS